MLELLRGSAPPLASATAAPPRSRPRTRSRRSRPRSRSASTSSSSTSSRPRRRARARARRPSCPRRRRRSTTALGARGASSSVGLHVDVKAAGRRGRRRRRARAARPRSSAASSARARPRVCARSPRSRPGSPRALSYPEDRRGVSQRPCFAAPLVGPSCAGLRRALPRGSRRLLAGRDAAVASLTRRPRATSRAATRSASRCSPGRSTRRRCVPGLEPGRRRRHHERPTDFCAATLSRAMTQRSRSPVLLGFASPPARLPPARWLADDTTTVRRDDDHGDHDDDRTTHATTARRRGRAEAAGAAGPGQGGDAVGASVAVRSMLRERAAAVALAARAHRRDAPRVARAVARALARVTGEDRAPARTSSARRSRPAVRATSRSSRSASTGARRLDAASCASCSRSSRRSAPGLGLQASPGGRSVTRPRAQHARRRQLPCEGARAQRVTRRHRAGDRDPPRRERAQPLQGHAPCRSFGVATGSRATRRRSASSRSSSCGRTRGGTRPTRRGPRASSRCRRARATRSAHAGWASRRASASTARRTRPRSATPRRTAASGCTLSRTHLFCKKGNRPSRRFPSSRTELISSLEGWVVSEGFFRSGSLNAGLVIWCCRAAVEPPRPRRWYFWKNFKAGALIPGSSRRMSVRPRM